MTNTAHLKRNLKYAQLSCEQYISVSHNLIMSRIAVTNWFIRLRWFSFTGQLIIFLCSILVLKLSLPRWEILAILLTIPSSIFVIDHFFGRIIDEQKLTGYTLALDTILLWGLLSLSGGPMNPFSIVFLLHVVLAAVLLSVKWTWGIAILSCVCFASLFLWNIPVPEWTHHEMHGGFSLHLHGMLLSYVLVALLLAYFLVKIVADLQAKERKIERVNYLLANQQRLASLTALVGQAAHELGTPLGTINLVSHEIARSLANNKTPTNLAEDVKLLSSQSMRCKQIISDLAAKTGEYQGEMAKDIKIEELWNETMKEISQQNISLQIDSQNAIVHLPVQMVSQALRALLKNAIEAATESGAVVTACISKKTEMLEIIISDSGCGMEPEFLERLGEPFLSTKAPGLGMGLGVYLAKLCAEQLGGSLNFSSKIGFGTIATMNIPA